MCAAVMSQAHVVAQELIEIATGEPKALKPLDSIQEAGLDSVAMFVLIGLLERRYGPMPPELVASWESVGDLEWFIERRELD